MSSTDNPNAPGNSGRTPIFHAASNGHLELVRLLMSSTDNPNAPDNDGTTPIHAAVFKGHLEVVRLLMSSILMLQIIMETHQ